MAARWNSSRAPERLRNRIRSKPWCVFRCAKRVHAGTDHRLEHLAQDVAIAKPAVAINRERRMIGNLVVELEAADPTITEMEFDLFAQLPFKADSIAVADNEHPDHQLRIDRGPPAMSL